MKKNIIKILSVLLVIIPMIVFLNISSLDEEKVKNINIIVLSIFEIINIGIMIYCLAVDNKNKVIMAIIFFFIIISIFIPIYDIRYTYAPTGPGSELMGLALKEEKRDMYGIDIKGFLELFK